MPEEPLPREELHRILLAVRAVARASGPLDFESILSAVLEQFVSVSDAQGAAIYLFDATRTKLVWAGATPPSRPMFERFPELPLEGSITGGVVAARRPKAIASAELGPARAPLESLGIAFVGIVPLYVQDHPCGVLHLARAERPFDEHALRVADTLGELLVVYLENAKLYAEAQARLEETAMLLDVARAITASLDLRQRLVASADGLARLVDASNAFILLVDEKTGELVVTESDSRWTGAGLGESWPAHSAAGKAIRDRKVIVIEDAQASPVVFRALVEQYDIRSLIALPLVVSDELIGCVVAIEMRHARAWTPTQLQRAEVIAHQIAIAVAHARLYAEVKRSYEELARTQEELVKRERLAALGQLAATLAHEVRNPLGVLFNSISTLGKTVTLDDDGKTLLGIMDEEARRLERLVRELLEFVRPVTPTVESESLHGVVDEALDAARRELGKGSARLSNEVSPALPPVPVDAAMLRRALLNLVVNGGQAAGANGNVAVRAATSPAGVRIEVVDDGPGIRPDVFPHIFAPFFTTKATGTGLGLAIVKEIVDAHRGEIRVDSGQGRGTTIAIELPVDRP
jgi:signal transduction histidine kinase